MSVTEDHPTTQAASVAQESAAKPTEPNLRDEQAQTGAATTGHSPDNGTSPVPDHDVAAAPQNAHVPPSASANVSANPFDDTHLPTPALPPRPEPTDTDAMATTATAAAATANANAAHTQETQEMLGANVRDEPVSPQVEALRAMFPDFDVAVLQSVLESVNNDQDRALDILLGMSDPEYVSTQTATQPEQQSVDLDEQLARQLLLEDQRQHDQQRRASGQSWPRRGEEQVPYQARQHAPEHGRPPANDNRGGDFAELQRTMGQIAESGKRTFSSIVSKVKAKINEYEQTRNVNGGQSSNPSTMPQWGNAPPAPVDRHAAQQAYQQQYYGAGGAGAGAGSLPAQPSPNAEPHQISLNSSSQVQGYDLDAPAAQTGQPAPLTPPTTSPIPTPAARSTSPPATSGLSPAASPRPSTDVPRPPATISGSPVNAAKIGLLPKRPVSLLNTNSPPARRPSDDDELEYVENPFEERK